MRKLVLISIALLVVFGLGWIGLQSAASAKAVTEEDPDLVALGKLLFFDPDLSINGTQSCASCHAPEAGFSGPDFGGKPSHRGVSRGGRHAVWQPQTAIFELCRGQPSAPL